MAAGCKNPGTFSLGITYDNVVATARPVAGKRQLCKVGEAEEWLQIACVGKATPTAMVERDLRFWAGRCWLIVPANLPKLRDATGYAAAIDRGFAAEAVLARWSQLWVPFDIIEERLARLPEASVVVEVTAGMAGVIQRIDTEALGQIVVHLGGGVLRRG